MEFTSKFIDVHRFISQRMAFFLKKDHDNPILVQDNRVVKNIIVSLIIFLLCLVIKKEIALNIFCLVVTDVCFHYDLKISLLLLESDHLNYCQTKWVGRQQFAACYSIYPVNCCGTFWLRCIVQET